jgi:hypothetical protein
MQTTCPRPWEVPNSSFEGKSFSLGERHLTLPIALDSNFLNRTTCLLDTAADVTMISDRMALHYPSHFMCHNQLMQGIYGRGAHTVGHLYICFTKIYISANIKSTAVVLVTPVADKTFTTKHKCILGYSTLEVTQCVLDFRCRHILFSKGEFMEQSLLYEDVRVSMFALGINEESLIPYDQLNPNITENVEALKLAGKGKHILTSSIANLGFISSSIKQIP